VRQRLATSRKRVLRGRTTSKEGGKLRSVDSECEGRVTEPRKREPLSGALGLRKYGGRTDVPRGGETAARLWTEAPVEAKAAGNSYSPQLRSSSEARREGPTGVGEQGIRTQGSSRNLGDHVVSVTSPRAVLGDPGERYCGAEGQTRRNGKGGVES
jgi:hypothetical protein